MITAVIIVIVVCVLFMLIGQILMIAELREHNAAFVLLAEEIAKLKAARRA